MIIRCVCVCVCVNCLSDGGFCSSLSNNTSANAAVSGEQINLDVVNAALMLSKDQLEILIAIHSTKPPIAYTVY